MYSPCKGNIRFNPINLLRHYIHGRHFIVLSHKNVAINNPTLPMPTTAILIIFSLLVDLFFRQRTLIIQDFKP